MRYFVNCFAGCELHCAENPEFSFPRRHRVPFACLVLVVTCCLAASGALHGQDAPSTPAGTTAPASMQTRPPSPVARDISWLRLPSDILHDQKKIASFPASVAHGHHLLPTFAVVGITAALIAADQSDTPHFRRTTTFQSFNQEFSGHNTDLAIVLAPTSLYAIGLVRKDSYEQKTALLAGEAVADSLILATVLKMSTLRLRPSDIPPQGDFSDSFWLRRNAISSGSFPSGHTIAAFSVATILAERYSKRRWVSWAAYGAATAIGFSRITLQAHFPSDVFLGGALGYSVSRFVVLGAP